jgi:hypothetical protein
MKCHEGKIKEKRQGIDDQNIDAALELHSDYVFIAVHMTYPVPQI